MCVMYEDFDLFHSACTSELMQEFDRCAKKLELKLSAGKMQEINIAPTLHVHVCHICLRQRD